MASTEVSATLLNAQWEALMRRYTAADKACDEGKDWLPQAEIERLGEEIYETRSALLAMPVQSPTQLRWKLEYLLATDGDGFSSPWSSDLIEQTLVDIRSMLSRPIEPAAQEKDITLIGLNIQTEASKIAAVVDVIEDTTEELVASELNLECGRERRDEVVERIIIFSLIAREAAKKVGKLGEEIEKEDFRRQYGSSKVLST